MKRFYLLPILLLLVSMGTLAQQPGSYYRQFFFNPYAFNPAYVGINNTEVKIAYRQQWTSFKDAPRATGLSFQTMSSDRVALGASFNTNRQVLLSNTRLNATFGYVLPISDQQSLRFGISAGMGLNKPDLNADELNTSDPTLYNAATRNFYVDGNFGMLYSLGGLRLGFALTELFGSQALSTSKFNRLEVSNLKNRLFSASYKFYFGPQREFALEPYALYRQNEDYRLSSWEAAAILHVKNIVWTGGSYNQHSGLALFMGINLKERFTLSYSYEFAPFKSAISSTSSHELQLGIRFNKKKSKILVQNSAGKPTPKVLANEIVKIPGTPKEKDLGNLRPRVSSPENDYIISTPPVESTVKKEPKVEEMRAPITESKALKLASPPKTREGFTFTKGHHYVVVAVFSVMSHSVKFTREMIQKGHPVNVMLNPINNFYYVYIYSSTNLNEARHFRNEYKLRNLFKEAWIFSPEK